MVLCIFLKGSRSRGKKTSSSPPQPQNKLSQICANFSPWRFHQSKLTSSVGASSRTQSLDGFFLAPTLDVNLLWWKRHGEKLAQILLQHSDHVTVETKSGKDRTHQIGCFKPPHPFISSTTPMLICSGGSAMVKSWRRFCHSLFWGCGGDECTRAN
jgi:hypothetical protein